MTAMTKQSERLGYSILLGQATNMNGDQAIAFELPAGYGEVYVFDALAVISDIATLITNPELVGPSLSVVSTADSNTRDVLDVGRWVRTGTAIVEFSSQMKRLATLRQEESIMIRFLEIDSNGAPTADLDFIVRVQRLRN